MSTPLQDRDLLPGIKSIAGFFGISTRQAKHWHETARIPTFKVGDMVCARRSTLTAWLAAQEACGLHKRPPSAREDEERAA